MAAGDTLLQFVRRQQRWVIWLALVLLAINAVLALNRSTSRILGAQGGGDFHSYWFSSHFLWQGSNPYTAFLARAEPQLPVHYLDGVTVTSGSVAQSGLARTPANTAPVLLLIAPLALLSWPVAKLIWFGINLALLLAFPWLVIRLWPHRMRSSLAGWFLALTFYGFQGTRIALWIGQTTILTLVLMTAAMVWRKRHPWLAGLMLGVAISKYSLALPVFVFLLTQRRYRVLAVSLGVQLAGLLVVSAISGGSPLVTLEAYGALLTEHTRLPGIHLGDLLRDVDPLAAWLGGVGTLLVLALLFYWTPKVWRSATTTLSPAAWAILSALSVWTLLAAYHRVYDTGLATYFVALILLVLDRPSSFMVQESQRAMLAVLLAGFIGALSLPGEIVGAVLPGAWLPAWLEIAEGAITVAMLVATGISIWLLRGCLLASTSANGAQKRGA